MLLVLLAGLGVAGCQWKLDGRRDPPPPPREQGSGAVWRIEPTSLRVYPSTRFAQSEGAAVLEARVELFDQMGDSTKGVGRFQFDLLETERAGGTGGRWLYSWNVTMETLEEQRRHYDPVTRTYRFRLRLEESVERGKATRLRVGFTPVDGPRIQAEATLGEQGAEPRD